MKTSLKRSLALLLALIFSFLLFSCSGNEDGNKPTPDVPEECTLFFDSNGGSEVAPVSTEYDSLVSEPPPPTREGYVFVGWYIDGEKWDFSSDTLVEDLTVTARWERN